MGIRQGLGPLGSGYAALKLRCLDHAPQGQACACPPRWHGTCRLEAELQHQRRLCLMLTDAHTQPIILELG